ncbi:MAG TPA: DUF4823 domain-containing protein [Phycisphaerales bacterium]|nr:DUF4823 domain-containing protein [Phycisphaerales bacterium]
MKSLAIMLCLSLAMVGCTSSYRSDRLEGSAAPQLTKGACSVYVSVPEDGSYQGHIGKGSGSATAKAIVTAFVPYTMRADCGSAPQTHDAGMASAASGGFTHYIEPTIMNWEDRATEWSGKLDAISVRLVLFEVPSRRQIDTVVIHGNSKWMTFGGDHPQDLLPEPMGKYAAQCFGAAPPTKPSETGSAI